MRRLVAAIALWLTLAGPALAQGVATLIADDVSVTADGVLVASGNVEVLYDGTRLTAAGVRFDGPADRLELQGPVVITRPDGAVLIGAEAVMDAQLQNGLLRSARLVLDRRLQLAAGRIDRVDDRLTGLYQVAATSCRVCDEGRPPLWQIRATRVVHDEEARQLYFDNAQFLIGNLPVFWLPRLRLPDPTLDRATGFLVPSIRSNDLLGLGIRAPYFIRLGDHRDLTLTPYVSPVTRTVELRFRQAFASGDIEINAAASTDTVLSDVLRGYLFAEGAFELGNRTDLRFDIEAVRDEAYLQDYSITNKDRLDSALRVDRVDEGAFLLARVVNYQSLRDTESNATQPTIVAELTGARQFHPAGIGGTVSLFGGIEAGYRYSDDDIDGRDVARAGVGAGWRNTWVSPGGLVADAEGQLTLDYFYTSQDSTFEQQVARAAPATALTVSLPLARVTPQGAHDLIEPMVQLAWSETYGPDVPNEDSTLVEFDEANLFALSRFPGQDAVETGLRLNIGATATRVTGDGQSATLSFGRVVREQTSDQFLASTGLDGFSSDWLLFASLDLADGWNFRTRTLFDDAFSVSRSESQFGWQGARGQLAASYLFLEDNIFEGREDEVSEWTVDGRLSVTQTVELRADSRFDQIVGRASDAGLGVTYSNECVEVDFSLSRKFSTAESLEPVTGFGLTVGLNGFSTRGSGEAPVRTCRN